MPLPSIPEAAVALRAFAARWRDSDLGERQSFQSWFNEFCDALGVERPSPGGAGTYCFEQPVQVISADGNLTTNFIDCWKAGHVAVEAKASGTAGTSEIPLRKAYKQLTQYIAAEPGTIPPYLMVVDVPRELIIWDGWRGTFGGFAAGRRIALDALPDRPDDVALLQDVFARPQVRDPRGKAQQVTREIAGKLAELAATFEGRGFESEHVARFLMRCVFCFFAEDVGLLPAKLFERTLVTAQGSEGGKHMAAVLTSLWRTMDKGGTFGADPIQRFNGHFFKTLESLPLEPADVQLLIDAARFDWSRVEPSIFGTLLVRALEPSERHKLGAEFTPREYIERLVEPTVIEPLRERWNAVQAHMAQLENTGKKKDLQEAVNEALEYHKWLRGLSFLDPACGSGNFLYVTMAAVKRIELEVFREVERLRGTKRTQQTEQIFAEVHPRQFHGIEVNWWAREIAELTLWIGYHQFWREAHGGRTPPVPILEDTGTIEFGDAILEWNEVVHRPEKDRQDPSPRIVDAVTGERVPDPQATLPYLEHVGARQPEWPAADFIIGNPPYLGNKRMRLALGDGYVEALRAAYPNITEHADLVMYWWARAAELVGQGATIRAGLITTNSITQLSHRQVVSQAAKDGARVIWAAPDHPWVDEADGAAVRVALTVLARTREGAATLLRVANTGEITSVRSVLRLNDDLTAHANVASAAQVPLKSNAGVSFRGVTVVGAGFIIEADEATRLLGDAHNAAVVKRYVNGRDLAQRPRGVWVIDFALMSEQQARDFPAAFDMVRTRVKPQRDAMKREGRRRHWWRFGEAAPAMRDAIAGVSRYIATPYVARHRLFSFVSSEVIPDDKVVVLATSDPFVLGVLSGSVHSTWAAAAGTRLGVGNDPTYNNPVCFDAFPFPDPPVALQQQIGALAEKLDRHRKDTIARDDEITLTAMYNVVERLRSGEALSPKERALHDAAACGVVLDLHNELDALVAQSYGWQWPLEQEEILDRLVSLHEERIAEEKRAHFRWLRPEYQKSKFGWEFPPEELEIAEVVQTPTAAALLIWPSTAVEQLEAISAIVSRTPVTAKEAAAAFEKADKKLVGRHLETLAMLGELSEAGGIFGAVRGVG